MRNSMSINKIEFSQTDTSIAAAATLVSQPAKFTVGIDTTILGCGSSKNLLNGASSQNCPITVLLNIAAPLTNARNLNLVFNYGALIEIDPSTSMVSTRI